MGSVAPYGRSIKYPTLKSRLKKPMTDGGFPRISAKPLAYSEND
jgi:hypothetical protein